MKTLNFVNTIIIACIATASTLSFGKSIDRTKGETSLSHPVFIQVHPFSLGLGAEVGLNDHVRVGAEGSFYTGNFKSGDRKESAGRFGVSGSYYAKDVLSDSGYIKAIAGVNRLSNEENKEKSTTTAYSIEGIVGYQWVYESGITLNCGFGAAYAKQDEKSANESKEKEAFTGIVPAGELALGFNF